MVGSATAVEIQLGSAVADGIVDTAVLYEKNLSHLHDLSTATVLYFTAACQCPS